MQDPHQAINVIGRLHDCCLIQWIFEGRTMPQLADSRSVFELHYRKKTLGRGGRVLRLF